jgi:hypothetical protein
MRSTMIASATKGTMPEHRAQGRKPLAKGGAVRLLAPRATGNPRV